MKLYCDPISTTSRPVMLFAAEAAIPLEQVHVDLMSQENRGGAYLALNPNGVVPYLVDGDFGLGESSAILKYLADKVGSPAYPTELKARARVNEAMDWFATNLHEYFCLFAIYPNFGIPQGVDAVLAQGMIAFGETHAPRWLKVLDQHMLGDRPFVCGEVMTLADYLGSGFITLGEAAAFDFSPYPNIQAWIARMKSLKHWGETFAAFNMFVSMLQAQSRVEA